MKRLHAWLERKATLLGAWASLVSLVSLPVIIVGGVLTYIQVGDLLKHPDIQLVFSGTSAIRMTLANFSPVPVQNARYEIVLFDLDVRDGPVAGQLLIPTKSVDYVRPGAAVGPYSIVDLASHRSIVQPGHRLFGWASVQCAECVDWRFYWLFIHHGIDGWYCEVSKTDRYQIRPFMERLIYEPEHFMEMISGVVPEPKRVAIRSESG